VEIPFSASAFDAGHQPHIARVITFLQHGPTWDWTPMIEHEWRRSEQMRTLMLDALGQMLCGDDAKDRRTAATLLGNLFPGATAAREVILEPLRQMLDGNDRENWSCAAIAIRGIGLAAAEPGIVGRLIQLSDTKGCSEAFWARWTLDWLMSQGARFFEPRDIGSDANSGSGVPWIIRSVKELSS
jgi:hypothetical protein